MCRYILENVKFMWYPKNAKVRIFVFRHVFFVSRIWSQSSSPRDDLWPFLDLISETGLKFVTWTQGEIRPGKLQASSVNRAHVKRP